MKRTTRNNLIFLLAVGAVIAALWLAGRAAPRRTGAVALVQYGDAGAEQRIPLAEDGVYQIDTGYYTIHLQVEDGASALWTAPAPTICARASGCCAGPATGPPACPPGPA